MQDRAFVGLSSRDIRPCNGVSLSAHARSATRWLTSPIVQDTRGIDENMTPVFRLRAICMLYCHLINALFFLPPCFDYLRLVFDVFVQTEFVPEVLVCKFVRIVNS
jgi:hypothetical protein